MSWSLTQNISAPVEWIPTRRRRVLRRSVQIGCEVVADIGFRLLGREILDLSSEGMLLATEGHYARIGEEVFVSFRAPSARAWIDSVGHISRIARGRRGEDRTPALGITFTQMNGYDRALLDHELRGLPPPAPARRPQPDYALTIRRIAAGT